MDDSTWLLIALVILLALVIWALHRSQYDVGFDWKQPHGSCERWLGRNAIEGYDTFCGKMTNRQYGNKWMCKVHHPNHREVHGE